MTDVVVAPERVRVASGCVVRWHGEHPEVLLTQRAPGRVHAGSWELPGGKVEPGERLAEAAVRELCEEIGLRTYPVALGGALAGEPFYTWEVLANKGATLYEVNFVGLWPCEGATPKLGDGVAWLGWFTLPLAGLPQVPSLVVGEPRLRAAMYDVGVSVRLLAGA